MDLAGNVCFELPSCNHPLRNRWPKRKCSHCVVPNAIIISMEHTGRIYWI